MARKNLLAGLTDPELPAGNSSKDPSLQRRSIRSLIGISLVLGKVVLLGL